MSSSPSIKNLACLERDCSFSLGSILISIQSLSRVWLFATPWTAARQASLSFTISLSLFRPMSIESVMPSNHLILCWPLLLLPSILPSIRVFSDESALHIRWPKYWSFSFSISPPNIHWGAIQGWFPLGLTGLTKHIKKFLKVSKSPTWIMQNFKQ